MLVSLLALQAFGVFGGSQAISAIFCTFIAKPQAFRQHIDALQPPRISFIISRLLMKTNATPANAMWRSNKKGTFMRKLISLPISFFLLVYSCVPALTQSAMERSTTSVDPRAESILQRMTMEEKIDLLGGVDGFFIRGIQRLGVPRLRMADGPVGVRNFGPATAMAGGIGLAATWNTALAERVGIELGRDARAKGVHFLLAPGVNIYRAPMNGRNFEYFGEDPFLASRIAVAYISGVQSQGVSATIKHFMGNNSEFDRHNTDSIIDERTMREIYLPTFEAAVKEAKVGAIMDAYNLTNGIHMTENRYLNDQIVRREWGFDGILMSDWNATYDAVAAANGGIDLEMPSGKFLNRANVLPAIEQGKVSVAAIDEKVLRILRTAARFGWLDRDQTEMSIPRFNRQGSQVALEAAQEAMVLLKNNGNLLPLSNDPGKSIAVIGPNAYPAVPVGGGSARVEPFVATSFLKGISDFAGPNRKVYYTRGIPSLGDMADATRFVTANINGEPGLRAEYFANKNLEGPPAVTRVDRNLNFGQQGGIFQTVRFIPANTRSARWTGYYHVETPGQYEIFAASNGEDGGLFRLYVDDKPVFDNWASSRAMASQTTLSLDRGAHKVVLENHATRPDRISQRMQLAIVRRGSIVEPEAKKLASMADVVVLAVGFDPASESEASDRTFKLPIGQDELIQEIAAANPKTIVVATSGGSFDMSQWLGRVPALIQSWYPGQEGGTALARVLFGEVSPSGRLPVTFERRWEDNPVYNSYYPKDGTNRVEYKEGIFVGYRGYERNRTEPLFPFGYGLSYATFKYSNLNIRPLPDVSKGGSSAGPLYEVSFDVTNSSDREAADVAQVYIGDADAKLPRPGKELKGFAKVNLRGGETRRIAITLDGRALSYYDPNAKEWRADPGKFDVLVGCSSAQIELRGTLTLPNAITSK